MLPKMPIWRNHTLPKTTRGYLAYGRHSCCLLIKDARVADWLGAEFESIGNHLMEVMNMRRIILVAALTAFTAIPATADLYTVTVLDSTGIGISGADVRWASGSWHSAGSTVDGLLTFDIPDLNFTKIAVTYNQGTVEKGKTEALIDTVWQTDLVRFELRDHAGNLIIEPVIGGAFEVGGDLDQGGGFWQHHGYTADEGYVDVELFPMSSAYKFRMSYNHNSETLYPVISGPDTVVFQTGLLVLDYDGVIRSNKGGSWWIFDGPSMELLPGTYTMYFDDGRIASYDVVAGAVVPVPGAVLLGTIGLTFAATLVKRRRDAGGRSR